LPAAYGKRADSGVRGSIAGSECSCGYRAEPERRRNATVAADAPAGIQIAERHDLVRWLTRRVASRRSGLSGHGRGDSRAMTERVRVVCTSI
jgi:hypothetical protein